MIVGAENPVAMVVIVTVVVMVAVTVVMMPMIVIVVMIVIVPMIVLMVVIMIVMTAAVAHRNHAHPGLNVSLQSGREPVPPLLNVTTHPQEGRFDKYRQGIAV